jgi:hypothetical protein
LKDQKREEKAVSEGGNAAEKKQVRTDYSKSPGEKLEKYHALRTSHPDWSKERCKLEAGYSEGTKPSQIEKSAAFQSLERQKEEAARELGLDFRSNMKVVAEIRDHSEADRDRLNAAKVVNSVMGYDAPQKLDVNGTGLFSELSGLSSAELERIAASIE